MIKWFNKQKPVTIAFITAITVFVLNLILIEFLLIDLNTLQFIKFNLAMSSLIFYLSWLMNCQVESSIKVFKEIDLLYFSAKKIKTKEEIIEVEEKYKELRKKCQNQGHYALMKQIYEILETKKEYIK
jgi:hypothetical protein